VFPHNCGYLNDLIIAKLATASIPSVDSSPRIATSDLASEQNPDEPRMIGDFDGTASEFWKLFRDEAKSHDDSQISTLKDGMDSALIFVRSYSIHTIYGLMPGPTGWFIFCCSHSICSR
jgi:hypothetical protein